MDARKNLVHFLLIFVAFVTWNCLAESKIDHDDIKIMYQAMSDRVGALEAAIIQHPAEIEKLRQEYRSEIDLLKKRHVGQISGLKEEIVALRLEHEIEIKNLKHEVASLRLEHESQIQDMKQVMVSSEKEELDGQENDDISTVGVSKTGEHGGRNYTENHNFVPKTVTPPSRKIKGSQKSGFNKRQAETTDHVAFFAKLSGNSLNMGSDQIIKFENCVTNIGNAYDSHIGVFKAPRPGVYLFSTTITTYGSNSGHIRIFINNVPETEFYLNGANNAWDETSQTIIVSLNQGDDVTIRSKDVGHGVSGTHYSIFSGVLLFEDVGQGSIVG